MKSGYDQFFKKAKSSSHVEVPQTTFASQQPDFASPKTRKQKVRKEKPQRSFPVKPMIMFFILLSGVATSIQYLDEVEDFLSSLEISMSSALANEPAAEKTEAKKDSAKSAESKVADAQAANAADSKAAEAKPADDKPGSTDDPTDYLFKLADRKKQLDKREAELVRREEEIAKLKAEIEAKLVELKSYRDNISVLLQDRVSSDSAKVETLVQVYSTMKPSQAAKVFETMDEDLVIEILSKMKKKSAADILNLVKSDKAQVLAEKYAGYRLPDRKLSSANTSSPVPSSEENNQQQPTKEESDQ